MNTGKIILSAVTYTVILTAFAVVYHDQFFGAMYRGFNIYSAGENVNIPVALIGSLIEGTVLAYCVQRFGPASGRVQFGIQMGLILCLFASSYGVFQTGALENVQGAGLGAFIALEFAAMMIYGTVGGALVGWLNREPAAA